jgi:anti-sigma B factor antagonist
MPSDRSRLKVESAEDGVRVQLVGCQRLDEEAVPPIKEQLLVLAAGVGAGRLLLDLGGVHFLTSTGLAMLVAVHNKLRAAGGRLTLCGVEAEVQEMLEVTQLIRVLDVRSEGTSGPKGAG